MPVDIICNNEVKVLDMINCALEQVVHRTNTGLNLEWYLESNAIYYKAYYHPATCKQ